jgi:hypothetical protein
MMNHDGWWEFTRSLLIEYGDIDAVAEKLHVSVKSGMRGNNPFEDEREELKELRREETEPMVREWLNDEIRKLNWMNF